MGALKVLKTKGFPLCEDGKPSFSTQSQPIYVEGFTMQKCVNIM